MKNDQYLTLPTVVIVTLIHIGLIAAAWDAAKQPEPVDVENLTFIDLGSLDGNDKPMADGAPAPLETAAPPPPKPEPPKPKEKPEPPKPDPKPKVSAVERKDKPADIVREPEKPKSEPLKPKPDPKPEPPKLADTSAKSSSSSSSSSSANAQVRSPDGVPGGGLGHDPNSKQPGNPASDHKGGDGKGARGPGSGPTSGQGAGNSIVDGGYIHLPSPPYPPRAAENEEEGRVVIEVIVEPDGRISSAKVAKSSGSRTLDNAALNAARKASIRPKMVNGSPARSRFMTPYDFKIGR